MSMRQCSNNQHRWQAIETTKQWLGVTLVQQYTIKNKDNTTWQTWIESRKLTA